MATPDTFELDAVIDQVRQGDKDAYRLIVRQFSLSLRAFLASQLHHLDDVDDLAQEIFITAFKHLERFRQGEDFAAWLRGIARNKLKTHYRTLARRDSAMDRFRCEIAERVQVDLEKLAGQVREQQIERLLGCISKLPEKMRHIVRAGMEGQRGGEVAEELGMTPGALYTTNHRANKLLRQCMEGTEA
jgi:RNA polymerase sigma-70 factor, ECF subfamily